MDRSLASDDSLPRGSQPPAPASPTGDAVSLRGWFAIYGLYLLATGLPLAVLVSQQGWTWQQWRADPSAALAATSPAIKLLAFAIYTSLCCTFLPLPAKWIVAAVAMKDVAVGPDVWTTTLAVAAVGAIASTMANLNDYHLFTWLLRSRRVGKLRDTKLYRISAGWFGRSPFFLVTLFNILPIPVDVVRILATTYRYPRLPFAAANLVGRFILYGVIAFVTYSLGSQGKWAVLALLGVAVILGAGKAAQAALRRIRPAAANAGGN
jgi:membrane protein YqaA with SNARE-associated domain